MMLKMPICIETNFAPHVEDANLYWKKKNFTVEGNRGTLPYTQVLDRARHYVLPNLVLSRLPCDMAE